MIHMEFVEGFLKKLANTKTNQEFLDSLDTSGSLAEPYAKLWRRTPLALTKQLLLIVL